MRAESLAMPSSAAARSAAPRSRAARSEESLRRRSTSARSTRVRAANATCAQRVVACDGILQMSDRGIGVAQDGGEQAEHPTHRSEAEQRTVDRHQAVAKGASRS